MNENRFEGASPGSEWVNRSTSTKMWNFIPGYIRLAWSPPYVGYVRYCTVSKFNFHTTPTQFKHKHNKHVHKIDKNIHKKRPPYLTSYITYLPVTSHDIILRKVIERTAIFSTIQHNCTRGSIKWIHYKSDDLCILHDHCCLRDTLPEV